MSAVYGCHNREPLRDTALVQSGWARLQNEPVVEAKYMTVIPAPMSKDCQYTSSDLGQADAKCEGCKHRAGRTPVIF